jgi:hypothetical protein
VDRGPAATAAGMVAVATASAVTAAVAVAATVLDAAAVEAAAAASVAASVEAVAAAIHMCIALSLFYVYFGTNRIYPLLKENKRPDPRI